LAGEIVPKPIRQLNLFRQHALVTVTETGQVTAIVTAPRQTFQAFSGTAINTVQIQSTHQHIDNVQTDVPGLTGLHSNDAEQSTSVRSTAPISMIVENGDGTPATGTITVRFDIDISPNDTSDDSGGPRFRRDVDLNIQSTYVDIITSPEGDGVTVFAHNTNTVLAIDTFFSSSSTQFNSSQTTSFSYTGTFPVQTNTFVNYADTFDSFPDGTFGHQDSTEATAKPSHLTWDFGLTTNGD